MKRIAIFGNAGGDKSTRARELASITGLPLHVLDKIQFRPGGAAVPYESTGASAAGGQRRMDYRRLWMHQDSVAKIGCGGYADSR